MVTIRPAERSDIGAITEIYNEAILTTTATFDIEPKTREAQLAWFEAHDTRHPILVAEWDKALVGWTSLTRWSDRAAYNDTAETSFYVKEGFRGRGVGRRLKESIVGEARRLGYHALVVQIAEGADASLHLNESLGFVRIGTLKEVGRKFGRQLDVHILQLILD